MVSRCPSCGSPTKEDERVCPSCGWDFVARKRVPIGGAAPGAKPPTTPAKPPTSAPPAGGGFSLPPAKNLNEPPPVDTSGLKALPKISPRPAVGPAANENPFTLPTAEPPPAPAAKKPEPAEKPKAEPPKEKEGFGARLFKSFRRDAPPAEPQKPAAEPPPPVEPPQKKDFAMPQAKKVVVDEEPVILNEPEVEEKPAPKPAEKPKAEPAKAKDPAPAPKVEEKPVKPVAAKDQTADDPDTGVAGETLDLDEEPPLLPSGNPTKPAAKAPPPPQHEMLVESDPAPVVDIAAEKRPGEQASAKSGPAIPPIYIAAIAGAALGTVSVLAVFMLLRPDTAPGAKPTGSPFAPAATAPAAPAAPQAPVAPPPQQSPAPLIEAAPGAVPATTAAPSGPVPAPPAAPPSPTAAAPAAPKPEEPARPAASFAPVARVVVSGQEPVKPPVAAKPEPDEESPKPAPKKKGPTWSFEGVVFDLMSTHGVFLAKLTFFDADGNEVGHAETGPGGRYKATVPAGGERGYTLKISHPDYTERFIDEGDQTTSLRDATPEERKMLMQAAARNLPWIGSAKKTMRRDLALVPRTPEEP